jgi:imidazoleglycerol-phosphate dehydratase/histidinol-phosphatase
MLDQLCRHGGIDLSLKAQGDLEVDAHHTIEDTALALGEAFAEALGRKKGIARYSFLLPMDESIARVALDFGGRPYLQWKVKFRQSETGGIPTEMFEHFFQSFCQTAKCNLHIKAKGKNDHHIIESIFKSWARCIKTAVARDESGAIPSTKGSL